jgi:hypothetical protein
MFPRESRQKVSANAVYTTADTTKTGIPDKAGFRLFITRLEVEVSVAAAQVVTFESNTTGTDIWKFSGNVLGLHGFDEGDVGARVQPDGEGVKFTSAAGPEFSYLIEGYYELVSPGT